MRFILAAAALSVALLIQGCRTASVQAASPPCVLVDVDMSGSQTDNKLHRDFGLLDEVVNKVLPRGSRVVMWGYDYDPERHYDGRPAHAKDLWPEEDQMLADRRQQYKLHPPASGHKCRTRLSKALAENVEEMRHLDAAGVASSLIVLSDGEDAYPERVRRLAKQLATLKHLRAVWVIGVVPGTGENLPEQVRHIFEPVSGHLIVSERHDRSDGLKEFANLTRQ